MRSILKSTLILIVIFSAGQVMAQNSNKTLLQTEQMATKLGLSDKQKTALDKELKTNQEKRKATMEKMKALREEMRRDAFVENQARMERMKSILTPEQFEKFQQLQKEGKDKRQHVRGQRQGQRGQGNVRGQQRGNGQRDFFGRSQQGRGRMMLRKRAQEKELQEKKEKGGDGGN